MHTGKWSLPKLSEWTDQSASIVSSGDTILRSIADGLPLGDTLVGYFVFKMFRLLLFVNSNNFLPLLSV